MTCSDNLPVCGGAPATGECGASPALGPNDGKFFPLGVTGRIELAFLCSEIVETGSLSEAVSPDFKIWATVPPGAMAVVEVSRNGTDYVQLDFLDSSDKSF